MSRHAESLLAVRGDRMAESLPVGPFDARLLAKFLELIERPIAWRSRLPRFVLAVGEQPSAGLVLFPVAQHRDQSRRQAERRLRTFGLEIVLDLEEEPGHAVVEVDVLPFEVDGLVDPAACVGDEGDQGTELLLGPTGLLIRLGSLFGRSRG